MILVGLYIEILAPEDRISFWYLLTVARIQYAKLWKQIEILTIENWLHSVIQIVEMDKLTRKIRNRSPEKFNKCWEKN